MDDERMTTIGGCHVCKRTFSFVPGNVTAVTIDPETGLPPGMTVLGTFREPTPEATARSVEKFVCPDCVSRAERFSNQPEIQLKPWRRDPG